jgi:DNA recombination protein RmuC
MSALSSKSYWDQFQPAPEFVFMFLPEESFYSAALEQEPSLIEEGVKQGVIIATPVSLIALLRAVEFGWRQEKLAEHAGQIGNLGKELHDRVCTMGDHFARLGSSLYCAVEGYNHTLGSLETRVLVSAKILEELAKAWEKVAALREQDLIDAKDSNRA